MNGSVIKYIEAMQKRKFMTLAIAVFTCVLCTLLLDYWEAQFHNTSFYFSESFLFSSFWWLFVPFLYGQLFCLKKYKSGIAILPVMLIPVMLHLFAYPALVWLISFLFYDHTFYYWQTFQFGITTHFFTLLLFYLIPPVLVILFSGKLILKKDEEAANFLENDPVTSFAVTEGNKHINVNIKDVLYFTANPPYMNIHQEEKKSIYKSTLRSVSTRLDPEVFTRIHKSAIVNITKVHFYQSRLNGDYDLTLVNGVELRLSRNYAKDFLSKFKKMPQNTL